MTSKPLGTTGLKVSIVGLGALSIGLRPEELYRQHVTDPTSHYMNLEAAVATVVAAMQNGCTLIDTAPKYCNTMSEHAIGEALRRRPRLFDRCLVTTKIGCRYPNDGFDHSYEAARSSLLGSMERLKRSQFDLVYLHDPMGYKMENVFNGSLRALTKFRDAGVINHIGIAANDPETAAEYMQTGKFEVATVSGAWSLINQTAARRIIPLARKHNIGLVITTGLERGILATGPVKGKRYLERKFSEECLGHIRKIHTLCEEWNIPLGAAALQWCTRVPEIASVIPGACNPEEAAQNAHWGSLLIPDGFWSELKPLIKHFEIIA